MRKSLMLVAVVGLALLVAVPAMALDFKFGAEYRVRFYTNSGGNMSQLGNDQGISGSPSIPGTSGLQGNAGTQRGVQVRIRPRFDVSDDNGNMTATLRLEIGDIEWGARGGAGGVNNGGAYGTPVGSESRVTNGGGGSLGADGVNVETKWAYVDFSTPWGVPLRWRAGLQPWYESKGMLIDDDIAGLRAYGKAGAVSYEVGWYRAQAGCRTGGANDAGCNTGGGDNLLDNNYDFYEAKVGFAAAKWLNPTLYYIFGDNRASNTATQTGITGSDITKPVQSHFFGLAVNGDLGFMRYDVDFLYGQANGAVNGNFGINGSRVKAVGWGADAGVHFPIGPVLLHVVGSYATGDKQDGGNSETLPWIAPSWNGAGGLYEMIGSGGAFDQVDITQDYPGGLWMLGVGAEYRPVKALWLRGMYGYAGFTSKRANCAYSSGKVNGRCFGPFYGGDGYVPTTAAFGTVVPDAQGKGGLAGQASLGHEISFRADYDLWTNFKVQGAAGVLLPSEGETVMEYVLQFLYSF